MTWFWSLFTALVKCEEHLAPSSGKTVYCLFVAVSRIKKGAITKLHVINVPKWSFNAFYWRYLKTLLSIFLGKVQDLNACVSRKSSLDRSLFQLEYIIEINIAIFQFRVLRLSLFTGDQHENTVYFRIKVDIDYSVIPFSLWCL